MSSCQGELPERKFFVKATEKDGNVLFNDNIATLQNGFFELWLPRDRSVELRIKGMGRQVIGRIGTFDKSKTCITTFRLR
jgi:hypothetical protein